MRSYVHAGILLIGTLCGAWLIGPRVIEMLPFTPDATPQKQVDQSGGYSESTSVQAALPQAPINSNSSHELSTTRDAGSTQNLPVNERVQRRKRIHVKSLTGESETALLDRLKAQAVRDPEYVGDWIDQTLSRASQGLIADTLVYPLLYLWVEIEPDVAITRLGEFASESEIPYLMLSHAQRLADERTPAEALDWAGTIADKASSELVVDGLLQGWLERDVAGLATHIELIYPQLPVGNDTVGGTFPEDDQAESLATHQFRERVARALIEQDPARALQWADSLPGIAAEQVRAEAFVSWLKHDPVVAADWLSGVLGEADSLSVSLAAVVPVADIDLAIAVLPSLSGSAQSAMTSTIVEKLSKENPNEARAWVDGLADPKQRSSAVTVWALNNAMSQPAEALDSILQSASGLERVDLLMEVASMVGQVDQPLLESWLAYAALSDYERSTIASAVLGSDAYPFH